MRTVIQRVTRASVTVEGKIVSKIKDGLLVLVGVEDVDTDDDIEYLTSKIVNLRIFNDENGVMNKSVIDINGDIIAVSQFTLFAATRKGNRPSYIRASKREFSKPMYEKFCESLSAKLSKKVGTGVFGADMKVDLLNDGPMTIIIDSKEKEF